MVGKFFEITFAVIQHHINKIGLTLHENLVSQMYSFELIHLMA